MVSVDTTVYCPICNWAACLKCGKGNNLILTCSNCKVIIHANGQFSRQRLLMLHEYPNQYRNLLPTFTTTNDH